MPDEGVLGVPYDPEPLEVPLDSLDDGVADVVPDDDESLEEGALLNGDVEPLTAPLAALDSAEDPDEPDEPDEEVSDLPAVVQAVNANAQAIGIIHFFI